MVKRLKDGAPPESIDWQRVSGSDEARPPARRAPFRFGPQDQPPDASGPAVDPWKELLERGSMHEVLASVRRVSGVSEKAEERPSRPAEPVRGRERARPTERAPQRIERGIERNRSPAQGAGGKGVAPVPRFAASSAERPPRAAQTQPAARPPAEPVRPRTAPAGPPDPRTAPAGPPEERGAARDPLRPRTSPPGEHRPAAERGRPNTQLPREHRPAVERVRPTTEIGPASAPAGEPRRWKDRAEDDPGQLPGGTRPASAGPPRPRPEPAPPPPRPSNARVPSPERTDEPEPARPDRRIGRPGKPPPSFLLAERADRAGETGDDRSDGALPAERGAKIDLDFVPRRLIRAAPPTPRAGFRRAGMIALMIAALGVGLGFGLAREGADWSLPWPPLTDWRNGLESVRPAGGPLPQAPGPAQAADAPSAAGPLPAEGAGVIPIPSRRPIAEDPPDGADLAAAGGADEVVEAGFGEDDTGQLPPLFLGRVFVHYAGPGNDEVSRERAERIARALEADGYRIGAIRPAGFAIRTSSVRYFFDTDRMAAARLRDDLPPALAEQTLMMDFTSYEPRPRPGTIELWLGGSG